jgi:hypothetical protein
MLTEAFRATGYYVKVTPGAIEIIESPENFVQKSLKTSDCRINQYLVLANFWENRARKPLKK